VGSDPQPSNARIVETLERILSELDDVRSAQRRLADEIEKLERAQRG
jgi:hypothetical protein